MPKILCLVGLVIAILILLLFLADLVLGMSGQAAMAPLRAVSYPMDIIFVVCALGLAYSAWTTFREQR
ncbi:MAG: hypothetical protein KDB03_08695 [Planctomycetales bacterium]|nr:hypothetical protein [Planctomycetales bacterium]